MNGTAKTKRMSSRNKILEAVRSNVPEPVLLPQLQTYEQPFKDVVVQFKTVLQNIGGMVHEVPDYDTVIAVLKEQFANTQRIVSRLPAFQNIAEQNVTYDVAHHLKTVDLAILKSNLAVAENGAVWITDADLPQRVLPFIAQHLAVVITKDSIVPTLHEAYEKIGAAEYGFAVFVAGPSKTADIEQSLVLGAHGPKTMTVFMLPHV
jgi:L-lactate dehydrogenase complex protein LldG